MRTLYESILDDEDILIQNTQKYVNNEFGVIANIFGVGRNTNFSRYEKQQIKSLLEHILRDVPNNKDLLISFGSETVWVNIEGKNSLELITLRPSRHWINSYVIDKNSKMAIWFLETNVDPEAIKDYGFKSMNKYESWKTNIISKYDLNPSKDKYLYTK